MLMNNLDYLRCALGLSLLLKVSELLLLRLPSGTIVRVSYPAYAAGLMGVIESQEKGVTRWLIKLQNNPFEDSNKPVILSLESSDFQVVELIFLAENQDNTLNNDNF